jgi:beta-barrel assembly-enhancing protease
MTRATAQTITSRMARSVAVLCVLAISQPMWLWAATRGPELPNPGTTSLTREQQIQLGQKAKAEVYQQMPVLPDNSPVTQYVRTLTSRLVAQIPQQYSWPYEFHVIQQKEVNAFAVPGGPIFINVGTIETADNEAQLAGVIAHEMSHVYMQHSAKQIRQNTVPSIIAGLGSILGSMIGGVGGALAQLGGQVTGGLMSMKYSRADEAQADAVGAIIMYKAGYDPRQLAVFFQKLGKEGSAGPQMLSDHPNPGNRYQAISNEIAQWPQKSFATNTGGFQTAKAEGSRVKAYTAEQIAQMAKSGQIHNSGGPAGSQVSQGPQGTIGSLPQADIAPSGNFQQLEHSAFTIDYPSNWRVYGDQNSQVTIAPQNAVAQDAIAVGAIVNGFQPQAQTLDDAFSQLVGTIRQSNPDLRQIGSAQTIRVNGVQGKSVDLSGPSPVQSGGRPLTERDWLVAVPNSQGVLVYAIFIAPEQDFSRLRPTYEQMLRSFHVR